MSTATVHLPEEIVNAARAHAAKSGITVEELITLTLADGIVTAEQTEAFFRQKRESSTPGAWRAALATRPNRPPDPGDEIE